MGLTLRLNLFYNVEPDAVYRSLEGFYRARRQSLKECGDDSRAYELLASDQNWTVLSWDGGWEWDVRRQAQFHVSRELSCMGFLIFVYDGDYWGYEFFEAGLARDHFVQDEDETSWFPDRNCHGNPMLLAKAFEHLDQGVLSEYLALDPAHVICEHELTIDEQRDLVDKRRLLDTRVQPTDEFTRFAECAVLNFLRYLGVRVDLRDHYVTFLAPKYRSFRVANDPVP
jgi:hypothetical protein